MNKIVLTIATISSCLMQGNSFMWPASSMQKISISNQRIQSSSQLSMAKTSLEVKIHQALGRFDTDLHSEERFAEEMEMYKKLREGLDDQIRIAPPATGTSVTGTVIDMDEFGALIDIGGKTSAFMPVAEASLRAIPHVNEIFQIGQQVTSEVIGLYKGTPVLSLRKQQLEDRWSLLLQLKEKDEAFESTILAVNKGGAICSAYGLVAFLPGSHTINLADESMVGKKLKVKFLDLIPEDGKIVLSQRRALANVGENINRGDVIEGKVTGLKAYGVFLEFPNGLTGLLHISQISYDRVDNVESIFSLGSSVKAMVLDIDKRTMKLALATKVLEVNPGDMLRNKDEVFANAEETAKKYNERQLSEKLAREAAAKEIVAGLGGALDFGAEGHAGDASAENAGADPLVNAAASIESILAAIVGDNNSASSAATTNTEA